VLTRRVKCALAAFSVVLAPLLVGCGGSGDPPSTGGIPASVRTQLLEDALTTARQNGDPRPYDIEAVRTTYGEALNLRGARKLGAPASRPVYLIAMRGDFKSPQQPERPVRGRTVEATPLPTVMEFEVDIGPQANDQGASTGWGSVYPDLDAAGTPARLEN
jgi:hypothetical protein